MVHTKMRSKRRPFCVLAATIAMLTGSDRAAAGLDIPDHHHREVDRDGARMTHGHRRSAAAAGEHTTTYAAPIQREELEATEAILRDYAFTSSLRDNALRLRPRDRDDAVVDARRSSSSRHLAAADDDDNDDASCLASGASCNDDATASCCRGGCNSDGECFCQPDRGPCFALGSDDDPFCCSNRCGADGRCATAASDSEEQRQGRRRAFFALIDYGTPAPTTTTTTQQPTPNPTRSITERPTTGRPTKNPTTTTAKGNDSAPRSNYANCQRNRRVCFNRGRRDPFCCSTRCGDNGRCREATPAEMMSENGNDDGTSPATGRPNSGRPTERPSGRPSKMPTRVPTGEPTETPTRTPTEDPTKGPTATTTASSPSSGVFGSKFLDVDWDADPSSSSSSSSSTPCDDPNERKITIEIETDQFGGDVSWSLSPRRNPEEILAGAPQGTYGLFSHVTVGTCVPSPGLYDLDITDQYGDGICCAYGEGYVKVYVDDREAMHVTSYGRGMRETINVGFDPEPVMTARDRLYLDAHNDRRALWHEGNGLVHEPLLWSPMLAEESRVWAEELLVNCSGAGIEHEPGVAEGENLAKNTGSVNPETGLGWGQLYPPTNIVGRWVDFEVDRPYPGNAHLTQALWRPSKYMGCGESEKNFRSGKCRVQVCRYARAGNCDMKRFNATVGRNWLEPMLAETSRCGPNCPPEGCF